MEREFRNLLIEDTDDLLRETKRIESLVRNSKEYRAYLSFCNESLEIKKPHFFIDKEEDGMTLEFHHFPITLFSLVQIIGSKYIDDHQNQEIFAFDIAREVIKEHLEDRIGGIFLEKTIHELYHSGQYSIPTDSPTLNLGKYKDFFKIYKGYLLKKDKENYKKYGAEFENEEE